MDFNAIKLLILDVDGVLTDGRLAIGADGESHKSFHVRDGCAIKLWRRSGGQVAILSGRTHPGLARRAVELEINLVETGQARKLDAYQRIVDRAMVADAEVGYVGDDLPDLAVMRRCAWPVAVAGAAPDVKRVARYVTRAHGGRGAVAEVVELLMRKQKRWTGAALDGA
jgi:3-deoxy-D-manno-octulosonate 8-phosphate phosphatase (KDO 8-P phosphatase)